MRLFLILMFFLTSTHSYAQAKLNFEYDSAGNQIKRFFELKIVSARSSSLFDEIEIVKEEEESIFETYPNPTPGPLTIRWYKNNITDIKLFNLIGKELRNYKINKSETSIEINISNVPIGIYVIHFMTNQGEVISRKIIKK